MIKDFFFIQNLNYYTCKNKTGTERGKRDHIYGEEMIRHEMIRNMFLGHITSAVVLYGLIIRVNVGSENHKRKLLL